jgi:hypothetical protein
MLYYKEISGNDKLRSEKKRRATSAQALGAGRQAQQLHHPLAIIYHEDGRPSCHE